MRGRTFIAVLLTVLFAAMLQAQPGRRRALLIGINDYSASRLPAMPRGAPVDRAWSSLDGAVNDVDIMRGLLVALYGFKRADIVTLTDQQATRDAILRGLQKHLLAGAQKGDVVFFYFSGHGSQVRNSLSKEADRLDESLVPADSRRGAEDLRDKELLPFFNGILDRGARLTIVLDTCHSGSGARGLDGGLHYRAIKPEPRDVADPSTGPRPEQRGALILSAAQDFDLAFETLAEGGRIRGAFTWALARALRDAEAGEPASDTFLRARARLQAERPAQDPVLAGRADARRSPFLGVRIDRDNNRAFIAVEKAIGDGTYLLQGGWASGVTIGSELRLVDEVSGRADVRLEVTSLLGVSHSIVRVRQGVPPLYPGELLELVSWAAPPSPPLRVWIPHTQRDELVAARTLHDEAAKRGIRWIDDPTDVTPTHLLRWRDDAWELLTDGHSSKAAPALLEGVPAGASLFVQFPPPPRLMDVIDSDAIGSVVGVEFTSGPETADYVLAGRFAQDHIEYAWVRPFVTASDRTRSVLPLRTAWTDASNAFALRENLMRLRRVQGWHELRSPRGPARTIASLSGAPATASSSRTEDSLAIVSTAWCCGHVNRRRRNHSIHATSICSSLTAMAPVSCSFRATADRWKTSCRSRSLPASRCARRRSRFHLPARGPLSSGSRTASTRISCSPRTSSCRTSPASNGMEYADPAPLQGTARSRICSQ